MSEGRAGERQLTLQGAQSHCVLPKSGRSCKCNAGNYRTETMGVNQARPRQAERFRRERPTKDHTGDWPPLTALEKSISCEGS